MKKSRGNKGQFSIIAAILVSIILVAAVIMTYSMIRHNPTRESPKVLTSIAEVNLAVKRILEFTVGYYGSILQVTGNTTYAKGRAASYFQSGLVNIAHSHPEWNPSFEVDFQRVSTRWYMPMSYSMGNISVIYSLSGLGVEGVDYTTSSLLKATVLESMNNGQTRILVMREGNDPELKLRRENFFFYNYSYSDLTWNLVHPDGEPVTFSNGTYILQIPSGVDQDCFSLKVVGLRGITVIAFYSKDSLVSGIPQYSYTFTWNSSLYSSLTRDTLVVEALQNGTLRWLDQNLLTNGKPIPPIPVKALHVNQTIEGVKYEVPFQVEDWGSKYRMPLGLTSNASVLNSRNMLAFLVNHKVEKVTLWWDGMDVVNQTSYAWKNRYFVDDDVDDPSFVLLSNGILDLTIDAGGSSFTVISTLGDSASIAEFMRINGKTPIYGSDPGYVIHHGIVRDIVQAEAEWSGGIPNCANVYSQIVLTLPANATYYTYALRLIFVNSSKSRTITDLSPIQLTSDWMTGLRSLTENGTSGGFPIIGETLGGQNKLFYNFSSPSTGWAHHWSEYISGSSGAGMMFTDSSNRKLYTFDSIAGGKTGALSVTTAQGTVWATPTTVHSCCGGTNYNNAIDGSTWSYWQHSTAENHWIILDLGKTVPISRIRIYQSGTSSYRWGQSNGIEVYVSDDPANWGSAVWVGALDASGWRSSGAFSAQGRYVKLVSRSTSSWQRLYEVEVETQEGQATIEFNPVERYPASFTSPLDVAWHGAVGTFENEPIYPSSGGNIGLWIMVERPPTVAVS